MESAADSASDLPAPFTLPPGYGPSRRPGNKRVFVIVGVTVLVLIIAGVLGQIFLHPAQTLPAGGPNLVVPAPATAGPLTRDYAAEQGAYKARIQAASQAMKKNSSVRPAALDIAVYREPGHLDSLTGSAATLVYLGMQFPRDMTGSLSDFMAGVTNTAGPAVHLSRTNPGQPGGVAECGGTAGASYCVWAAGHSAGMLIGSASDYTPAELAALMRDARPAFQTVARARS